MMVINLEQEGPGWVEVRIVLVAPKGQELVS